MRYIFHCIGQDEAAHNGKRCQVLRNLGPDEADLEETGPMYEIEFADGSRCCAFPEELIAERD